MGKRPLTGSRTRGTTCSPHRSTARDEIASRCEVMEYDEISVRNCHFASGSQTRCNVQLLGRPIWSPNYKPPGRPRIPAPAQRRAAMPAMVNPAAKLPIFSEPKSPQPPRPRSSLPRRCRKGKFLLSAASARRCAAVTGRARSHRLMTGAKGPCQPFPPAFKGVPFLAPPVGSVRSASDPWLSRCEKGYPHSVCGVFFRCS